MRAKLLAFLCALSLLLGAVPVAGALEGEAQRAADTLSTLGLVEETTALSTPATRAQAAVLLVNLAGAKEAAAKDNWISGFRDVPAAAHSAITYATHQGWITGVTTVEFRPDQAITANAWSAFLLRMLGYSDRDGDFAVSGAAAFAQRIGLVSSAWEGALTLGGLYQMALDALSFSYRDGSGTVLERLIATGQVSSSAANALGLLNPTLTARQIADRYTAAVFCLQGYEKQAQIDAESPATDASGFFISADGVAVTNYHSIDGAIYATATLTTGDVYAVDRVLYYDTDADIAVLKISQTALKGSDTSAFAYLEMAGTHEVFPGDTVYTISNPLGRGLSVSSGIVSAVDRQVEGYSLPCLMNTADISQGSSGGALLNAYGHVLSVTTGAFTYGNNMYLSVPVDPVMTADLTVEGWTLAEVVQLQEDAD